jgi:hypothetical protein
MPGYSFLFRSRWLALIWAAGIPGDPVPSTNVSFPVAE